MIVINKEIIHRSRSDRYKLYALGDAHLGSIHSDEDGLEKVITKIKGEPNSFIIGMGDWCEAILANDKRFDSGGLAHWCLPDNILELQRRRVVEILQPVRAKVLAFLIGNHEEIVHRQANVDQTRNICTDLDIPYGGYACFINLVFRRKSVEAQYHTPAILFQAHVWHGAGAAATDGGRMLRLMRLVNDFHADIYLMGHLHDLKTAMPDRIECNNGKIRAVPLAAAITGAFLKGYTQGDSMSYVEQKGYPPTTLGYAVVDIDPENRKVTVKGERI